MKKSTKFLAVALMLTLLFTIVACGTNNTPSGGSPASDSGSSGNVDPNSQASSASDSSPENSAPPANSPEGGVLVMATNAAFPPYEFYEGGKVVGIDAEIAEAIAQKLGMTLRIDDMDFDSIIAAVTSGKADIGVAGMSVTEDRLKSVNFSTSYATGVQVVIVREDSEITSVDDLFAEDAFTNISVQEATTGDLYTTWDLEDAGLAEIFRFKKGADAVSALTTGKVDCVVIDNEPAKSFVAANPGLKILETEYVIEDYAIAMSKDRPDLLDSVNQALEELIADGTVKAIIDKYIPAE